MRIVVTGGAGFIGSHLVAALVTAGHDVVVLDNLLRGSREAVPGGASFIEGDIRDPESVTNALRGADLVYHLAAQSNVMGAMSDVDYSFQTNVAGTFNVLKAARDQAVPRLVFASSREVYGDQDVLPVPESAPLLARNPYGASKLAAEAYCRVWLELAPAVECNILRFANVYGPGDRDRVIPLWIGRARAGQDLEVFGGQQIIDFVPIQTAVAALVAAGACKLTGPVNVGSGTGTPLLELGERIMALSGSGAKLVRLPARSAEVVRFVAAVDQMRAQLGVTPPADPLEALPAMVHDAPAAG
jgi:UDP-glucose 4-epimerase